MKVAATSPWRTGGWWRLVRHEVDMIGPRHRATRALPFDQIGQASSRDGMRIMKTRTVAMICNRIPTSGHHAPLDPCTDAARSV